MRKFVTFNMAVLVSLLALYTPAKGADYVGTHVPQAREAARQRVSFAFIDIYDATLYAPSGQYEKGQPFALSLTYLRSIPGKKIADHAVMAMRKQGLTNERRLAQWHERMARIFPDVEPGMTLTGISDAKGNVSFYKNGQSIGTIKDPEFEQYFFGIWLNNNAESPSFRKEPL